MDRGWYVRFAVVIALAIAGWLAVWPNLEPWIGVPLWVKRTFPGRISPGLDIQGGLRLMYEVEVDEAIRDKRDALAEQLLVGLCEKFGVVDAGDQPTREQLATCRQRVQIQKVGERRIRLTFGNNRDLSKLTRDMIRSYGDLREASREGRVVVLEMAEDRLEQLRSTAVAQAVKTISNRIDELQIRETTVLSRESDIIVEIPGQGGDACREENPPQGCGRACGEDEPCGERLTCSPERHVCVGESTFDRIRGIISRTARLEFKITDDEGAGAFIQGLGDLPEGIVSRTENVTAGTRGEVTAGYLEAEGRGAREKLQSFIAQLERDGRIPEDHQLALGTRDEGGSQAQQQQNNRNRPPVWRTYYLFDRAEITGDFITDAFVTFDTQESGKPVVALHFDQRGAGIFEDLTERNTRRRMAIVLDDRVESAPEIRQRIGGGRAQITLGAYSDYNTLLAQANDLVVVLKAGALPAPIRPANEQMIGPTLGADAVQQGGLGAVIGIGLVLLLMAVYYQVAGIVADVMVLLNLLFLFAILSALEGTLTLPGIAGIALTVGMAVDANVLITERIREELRLGKSPRSAVEQGFKRAFWSIFDSQLTTFIAAVVLFQYGTGPIKGFAVTLMIGIMTSLFTGVFCSRVAMEWLVRGLRVQRLRVG
jgi:preprotein translocase subunit SecD